MRPGLLTGILPFRGLCEGPIPVDELADRLDELPADVEVVAYCRGAYCVMSYDAVRLLRERGRRAAVLASGILEWRAVGAEASVAS